MIGQQYNKTPASSPFKAIASLEHDRGTVQRVDVVGREITLLLPTGLAVFDVPRNCRIVLRGESIKFRIVQPGDQVQITFARHPGAPIAQSLEVQPNSE